MPDVTAEVTAKELSPKMVYLLKKMQEGWELGWDGGKWGCAWIQKNGLGRGGLNETVSKLTVNGLADRGLIRRADRKGPGDCEVLELTEAGKAVKP